MKRGFLFFTLLAMAAVSRDAYRQAYRDWRQADPTLERDIATAGPALGADIDRVANEAAKYAAARESYLNQTSAVESQTLAALQQSRAAAPIASTGLDVVQAQIAGVRHSLDTYGNDPDPGIQQVRTMLERENLALVALSSVLGDAQKAADRVSSAAAAEHAARLKAIAQVEDALTAAKAQAAEVNQQASAWAEYYRKLSDDARGVAPAKTSPAVPSTVPNAVPPLQDLRPLKPAVTPLPLARYTGAWVFPNANGLFHGPAPEFVDLVVHDDNGHADGTLFARFNVSTGDPVIRFDFSGDFQKSRNQVFNLVTSDGAKGTIQLIPGPAFNLLEIDFQTEPKPGKIRQANFVLIKK